MVKDPVANDTRKVILDDLFKTCAREAAGIRRG